MPKFPFFALIAALFSLLALPQGPGIARADDAIIIDDLTRAGDPGTLHGTLIQPASRQPRAAILIIPGSGPVDRDGNIVGLRNDSLRMLGNAFVKSGIASLRYDKRGVAASADAGPDESRLTFETYVADAIAWLDRLDAETGEAPLYILGHSEGALIATLVAGQRKIDGLILLAGAGSPAAVVLRRQLNEAGIPDTQLTPILDLLTRIENGETIDDVPPQLQALFRPSVQPYMRSWFAYDPVAELKKVTVPTLVIQGNNDLQITVADAELLAAARPGIKRLTLAGMNHVLKQVPPDRAMNQASYGIPELSLHPDLMPALLAFIQ